MIELSELIVETKGLQLLYVEDNEDAREATLLILEDLFDDIIVAVDGQDGLAKFQNNKIDLIITDINMPNMDGMQMSRAIKQIDYDQPIIILTALTNISIIKEAIDIGVDCFINKPIEDIDVLFSKIEQIIKRINYDKTLKQLEQAKVNKEKIDLVFQMIKDISHHWKQPLSVISTISSSCMFKYEHGMELTKDDFENIQKITDQVEDLSQILSRIEKLDFENITLDEIKKIIRISNPLYEES